MANPSIPHYVWGASHILVFLCSLYVFLGIVTFKPHPRFLKIAFSSATASWGVVVYKGLGVPSLSRAYLQRALLDENVQYLLLALYWNLYERPIPIVLVPFATYSMFHTISFVRTLLPKAAAPAKKTDKTPTAAQNKQAAVGNKSAEYSRILGDWVKKNYNTAMVFVSYFELTAIMGRLVFGTLLRQNSFLSPILFAQFLRLRYYQSSQMRQAASGVSAYIDQLVAHPSCPEPVKKGILTGRDLVGRYASSIISQQPAAAAGGARNPATAAAPRQ